MFKERVLIHRKSLSKQKNESLFIPSPLSQEIRTGEKKNNNRNP